MILAIDKGPEYSRKLYSQGYEKHFTGDRELCRGSQYTYSQRGQLLKRVTGANIPLPVG
jgi:hypothetical protein